MPGAELSALKAWWTDGYLVIGDTAGNAIITVNPSSGGVKFANAGGVTISTGILGGLTISTGILGGLTVSSGLTLDGVATRTVTTAVTLAAADCGRIANCAVDGTFVTLPSASTAVTPAGTTYYLRNSGTTGAAQIILITATGESIIGAGISTTNLVSNTKATAVTGDYVAVIATASTHWRIIGMVGTWASTT